jgi:hypothetical protein
MAEEAISLRDSFTDAKVVVPQHVVHRSFPEETVVLNLQTGKYHGLNPTAGAMLAALERAGSIEDACVEVADRYELPIDEVEEDIRRLCAALLERDLIELEEET